MPSVPAKAPAPAPMDDVLMKSRREGTTMRDGFALEEESVI
jgi:hypothetical protein